MIDWNQEIAGHLHDAWQEFVNEQAHLFPEETGEPAVSGAFAPFLKRLCNHGLVVNTEYNKMNDYLAGRVAKALSFGGDPEEIKPDIIIHRANDDSIDGNLLAIEMKKWDNGDWRHDEDKLIQMTSPPEPPQHFQYRYGLLLRFRNNGQIGIATLFVNGKQYFLNPKTFRRA